MDKYVAGYSISPKGKSLDRYITAQSEKEKIQPVREKADFKSGYENGKLPLRLANKFMSLKNCGLNRFIEAEKKVVWALDEDGNIVRLQEDFDWVGKELKKESKNG